MILEIKGELDMKMTNEIMMKMTKKTELKSELKTTNEIKMKSSMNMTTESTKILEMDRVLKMKMKPENQKFTEWRFCLNCRLI